MPALMMSPSPEPARAQLRTNLAAYFHGQATAAPNGYPTWSASGVQVGLSQKLLVGDPVTLMVSRHTPARSSKP